MTNWVLIAEDHPLTREGLFLAARAALPGCTVVSTGTIAEADAELARREPCTLILLDFHLPDARGYSGFLQLQFRSPQTPIVVVTAREELSLVDAARALGAAGYVFKSMPLDEIAGIFRQILGGGTHFPGRPAGSPLIAAARERIADLSRAQHAVLLALADGHSNKEIAHQLGITEATVKAHLTAIFRKLGVTNRSQALLAIQPLLGEGKLDLAT